MTTPEIAGARSFTFAQMMQRFLAQGRLEVGLWLVTIISWGFLMVRTDWNLLAISVWSVPFLLMITAVSTPWRSVRSKIVFGFFMLGVGPVFLLVAGAGWLLDTTGVESAIQSWLFTVDLGPSNARKDVIAPVVEEALKTLPLFALFSWSRGGFRDSAGPLDFAVLAGATGAGLSFGEDIFVYLSQGSLGGPSSSAFGLGLGRVYGSLVGAESTGLAFLGRSEYADNLSFFFPEMQEIFGAVWPGHGALALGIGLSLGLARWLSRGQGTRLIYLAPAVVYAWAVWEHVMTNWYGGSGCSRGDSAPLCTLASIDLRGRIFPLLILVGWGYAMWISRRQLREHRQQDPALALAWNEVARQPYTKKGLVGWFRLAGDWFGFLRWRRTTGFCAYHLAHTQSNTRGQVGAVLASRVRTLLFAGRLRGSGAIVDETAAAVDRLAPIS